MASAAAAAAGSHAAAAAGPHVPPLSDFSPVSIAFATKKPGKVPVGKENEQLDYDT